MTRTRTLVLAALVAALAGGVVSALSAGARRATVDAFDQATKSPYVPPVKGQALLEVLAPQSKPVGTDVVTVIKVKNVNNGRLAGLKVDEYWYDKQRNPITGASYLHKKPLEPGEVLTITLKTPKDPRMDTNTYNFSHANGTIKASRVKSLDAPAEKKKK